MRRVAVIALCLGALSCANFLYGRAVLPLRVVVFNIHAGKDAAGVDNLERVAQTVRESGADIVLLQEVDRFTTRSAKTDQIGTLARLTGFRTAFGKTLDYQGGEYGIAVLSRWSIIGDTLIDLPVNPPQARAGGSYEPRGVLRVSIAAPGGAIHVFNTHLDPSRNDSYRRQEIVSVLSAARAMQRPGALVLVGGDLNSEPESAIVELVASANLKDLWKECGGGNGLTFPQNKPVKRIDYLFAFPGVTCRKASVPGTDASDHRPVLFELAR